MWTKIISAVCLAFCIGCFSSLQAQLIAGSPEDKAFQLILGENNPDRKLQLLLDFEKQFPQSKILSDVFMLAMESYRAKNDNAKVNEFGEKVIKVDPENVTALMAVARNYALEKKNLDRAVQYAQRAVDAVTKMKTQPAPANYSEEQWKQYVESTDGAAKSILNYAKSIKP